MKGVSQIVCAALFAGVFAAPAFAAGAESNQNTTGAKPDAGTTSQATTPSGQTGAGQGAMSAQGSMHIAQKMRDDLGKAGFTDIHIMPSSFLVRAKDSAGNPVMMVVNPDSVTAITEENAASNSSHNATGATPGPKSTGGSQPATPGASQTKP